MEDEEMVKFLIELVDEGYAFIKRKPTILDYSLKIVLINYPQLMVSVHTMNWDSKSYYYRLYLDDNDRLKVISVEELLELIKSPDLKRKFLFNLDLFESKL